VVIRTVLILFVTGLMACDSDKQSSTDTILVPDATDTTAPDTTAPDTSVPDTTAPDTTAPDTTAPDTVPDTAAPDTEPADTAAPDTTVPDVADTADASAGACDNGTDSATFASIQSTLEAKIQTCAFECLGQGATCAATCVQRETALSAACSACFGEVIACTITNCALQCLDANSQGCTTCRDTNCTPAFEACAGIEQP
jgi:hypothetical protein